MKVSVSLALLCLVGAANAQVCSVSLTGDESFKGEYHYHGVISYSHFDAITTYVRDDYSAILVHADISTTQRRLRGSFTEDELELNAHTLLFDGSATSAKLSNVMRNQAGSVAAAVNELRNGARRTQACESEAWYLFLVNYYGALLKDTYYAAPDCAVDPNDIAAPWYMLSAVDNNKQIELEDGDVEIACYFTAAPTYAPTAAPTYAPSYSPIAEPSFLPTSSPTASPTPVPSSAPTANTTATPTSSPEA